MGLSATPSNPGYWDIHISEPATVDLDDGSAPWNANPPNVVNMYPFANGTYNITAVATSDGATDSLLFKVGGTGGPTITGLNPTSAPYGSADLQVHVLGTNFVVGSQIWWCPTTSSADTVPTIYRSATDLEFTVKPSAIPVTGRPIGVYVSNPDGAQSAVQGFVFTGMASGATAGTPGTWTPAGSKIPVNANSLDSTKVTPTPSTAWTTGQHMVFGDGSHGYWQGFYFTTGDAP